MEDLLFDANYLNWIVVAVVFFIIEVSTFTLLFLWLGIAAIVMVLLSLVFPDLALATQLFYFAALSTISVLAWHFVFKNKQKNMGDSKMNNRASRYVGQTFTLVSAVENGYAKVKIEDSLWRVKCDAALAAGEQVKIVNAEGVLLIAEPV